MLEHTWDDGQVTTKPTCTKKGIRTYTCKVCKATKTADIEATGHDYKVKDHKDATCTEDGYTTSVCKNCGDEKKETIKATGHQHTEVRGQKKQPVSKRDIPRHLLY